MIYDRKYQTPRRNTEFYTEEDTRKMFKLFKEGATIDAIAAEFPKRTRKSVKAKMDRMGMNRRSYK